MASFSDPKFKKRLLMSILGVVICGISVGFFKKAAFGVDPYQTVMAGLDMLTPLSFGTVYALATAAFLVFAILADRHYIGIATVINLFFLGYIAQFTLQSLDSVFPDMSVGGRAFCLIIGIVVMCFSSALYFTADLGVSAYDSVSLIVSNTWHIGQFKYNRVISDLVCVVAGIVCYYAGHHGLAGITANLNVGTIITAFFMGPLIDFFNRKVTEPFLNR